MRCLMAIFLPVSLPCTLSAAGAEKQSGAVSGSGRASADEWFDKGYRHAINGDYDSAIAMYTKAIELKENFIQAYVNRGVAYGREDFQKACSMDLEVACRNLKTVSASR